MNYEYNRYEELRNDGMNHQEASEYIDKSNRTLFRYQARYKSKDKPKFKYVSILDRPVINVKQYLWQVDPNTIQDEDKIVGVIPDIHLPFSKWEYFVQVIEHFVDKGVNVIVQLGDMLDKHNISRFDSHPECYGTMTEYQMSMNFLEKIKYVFPYMYICTGNHDRITERQAATLGIPAYFIKSNAQLYEFPDTWIVKDFHIIDGVKYEHGEIIGGEMAHKNTARHNGMSTSMGHLHGNFGVEYFNNGVKQCFGMATGCLVDKEAYAFAYGKFSKNRPILGCGIVYDAQFGQVEPIKE